MKINEIITEDLRKWFKEKWVRFGPDGKIRGDCARGSEKEGKPKCLPQSKAHALGKKGRASAAARKRREDPNPERKGKAKNVATKAKNEEKVNELKCWKGYTRVRGIPAGAPGSCKKTTKEATDNPRKRFEIPTKIENIFDKMDLLRVQAKTSLDRQRYSELEKLQAEIEALENIVLSLPKGQQYIDHYYKSLGAEIRENMQSCPECGGEIYEELGINEKKDACYYKVKSRYKVWPSAYASGALVKCRKKGAKNWGNKK